MMLKTIRSKSIFINLIVTFITLTLLSTISYFATREFFRQNIKETVYLNLNITMDHIDRNMKLLTEMLNWLTLNNEIQAYVNATGIYPDDLRFKAIASYHIIRNAVYSNGLSDYINKLIVGNHMGNSVQFGIILGHQSDYLTSMDTLLSQETRLIPDPHYYSNGELVLPINYLINTVENSRSPGHLFLTLNTSIITRFTNLNKNEDDQFYMIAIGGQLYDIKGTDLTVNSNAPPFHQENIKTEGNRLFTMPSIPSYLLERNGIIEEYIVYQGPNSGWFLFQRIPENHMTWQKAILSRLLSLVILIMILMVLIITYLLDRTVNRPIIQVEKRISKIALGDFSYDPSIEFNNEIGNIGRGINHMVSELTQHIAAEIQNEKTKKDLEFKILQSQINPHFLYNTLNSIKWMATIQKSKGIAEMVGSLALLLKQLAKGSEKMISLKRELLLIEEYCKIQNYRSAGMVVTEYVIDNEELLNYSVIQFTLQPIVENAIFHGLEPRQLPGKITIHVRRKDENSIIIDVTDNGIGIPEHKIPGLLEEQNYSDKSMNHIGLKNVNDRLKLTYGKDYGLHISSIEGEYTKVSIVFPLMNENEEKLEDYV